MIKYMIHTCNEREWYVYEFLIPSLLSQGIQRKQIKVWHDYNKVGNLQSFVDSLNWIKYNTEPAAATWHLQDDIIISKSFKQKTDQNYGGIVCGFCCKHFDIQRLNYIGAVPARYMWFSFPCIRIPNNYAKEFVDWFYNEVMFEKRFEQNRKTGKGDDSFWRQFVLMKHFRQKVINLEFNIVDHVDYLIGGSIVNFNRGRLESRGFYWREDELNQELARILQGRV